MSVPIVPAVIPESEAALVDMTKQLTFSHELHLDLVDGKFVPTTSWPFLVGGEAIAVKPHTDKYTLEVDLMVENPIPVAREWVKAGADMLVFHVETIDLASFMDFVTYAPRGVTIGISVAGDTPMESIVPYLPYADYVQLMGIHRIGSQGQPFDETIFDRINFVRSATPEIMISVDGAVSEKTISRLVKAGVDRLIVGSAIVKQEDMEAAYKNLRACVNDAR